MLYRRVLDQSDDGRLAGTAYCDAALAVAELAELLDQDDIDSDAQART